jgi:hypothetical protein
MLGHLVLGSGFDPRDLASYAAGVLVALVCELGWRRHLRRAAARPVSGGAVG